MVVRKIKDDVTDEQVLEDLETYRQHAIDALGATDAKVITTAQVVIDERVRVKCSYPKCMFYGTSAHCPPHALGVDETRKIVNNFRYAIFTRLEVPVEEFSGPAVARNGTVRGQMKTHQIVTKLESKAFYDGYHLALGFACGPCKHLFCPTELCSALVTGQPCRHPLLARGSMESAGMDVFTMATRAGWNVYPMGTSVAPSQVPCAATYGLVLVY